MAVRRLILYLFSLLVVVGCRNTSHVQFIQKGQTIEVFAGDRLITRYHYGSDIEHSRSYRGQDHLILV